MAELLNYKFTTLGDFNATKPPYVARKTSTSKFNFNLISETDCIKAICKLNPSKPLGPSWIPAWALKDAKKFIAPHLTFLINYSIMESEFPNKLKKANVSPVHKKGDKTDPLNYRPISVTSALSKIYESILSQQINEYLLKNNILNKTQFGFQKGKSANDALNYFTEHIRRELDNNNSIHAAFLDLSKAFDSINHNILQKKLEEIGFSHSAKSLIKNYLSGRQQRVNVNGTFSSWSETYQGVPQGTILGPLLFLIYVYDLHLCCNDLTNLLQFADDTAIYIKLPKNENDTTTLKNTIENIVFYFSQHGLRLNIDKTEYIIFSRKTKNPKPNNFINIAGTEIRSKPETKYLGVVLDCHLSFDTQIKNTLRKMAAGIKTIYAIRDIIPLKARITIFQALVMSHLNYTATLFTDITNGQLKSIDSQISWGLKACCFKSKYSSSTELKLKHFILPADLFIDKKISGFVWKLTNGHLPAFHHLAFPVEFQQNARTKKYTIKAKKINTNYLKNCLSKAGCEALNRLPVESRQPNKKNVFKAALKSDYLKLFQSQPHSAIVAAAWRNTVIK